MPLFDNTGRVKGSNSVEIECRAKEEKKTVEEIKATIAAEKAEKAAKKEESSRKEVQARNAALRVVFEKILAAKSAAEKDRLIKAYLSEMQ